MGKNQNYEVESIVAKKVEQGTTLYEVKWKGYESKYNTWEPEENVLQCRQLIKDFERSQKGPGFTDTQDINTQHDEKSKVSKKISKKKEKEKEKSDKPQKEKKDKDHEKSPYKQLEIESKVDKVIGNFETDEADQIIRCSQKDEQLVFEVKWQAREDGVLASNSWHSNEEIRKIIPQKLIDFYQARVTFKITRATFKINK